MENIKVFLPEITTAQSIMLIKSKSIFLAGTIDNGAAENWQNSAIQYIKENYKGSEELIIINPVEIIGILLLRIQSMMNVFLIK